MFSYGWANDLVYRSLGEMPPSRVTAPADPSSTASSKAPRLALDTLMQEAMSGGYDWQRITMTLPREHVATVRFRIDQGNGGQPQHRHDLVLDALTGEVADWQPFTAQSSARQARSWIRFLHTGEALGLVGQTIAGIVSLTSAIMVWTGLALAYRRLVAPRLRASVAAKRWRA